MSNALATVETTQNSIQLPDADAQFAAKVWGFIAGGGDLEKLDDAGKTAYYRMRCESVGLDPATFPFSFIKLSGKLTLYATKTATDQLCHKRNISTQILDRQTENGVHVVTCRASLANNRFTDATGAVTVKGLAGDPYCNALMKAETKAKRRAVLALTGLGALDESELETIPNTQHQQQPPAASGVAVAADSPPARAHLVESDIATREQIAEANEWRRRAVAAGYRTKDGAGPKTIAEGEKLRNVEARLGKWRQEARDRETSEDLGEPNLEAGDYGPQTIANAPAEKPENRGPKYTIPAHQPFQNCTACGAHIAFARTESGKVMPIDAEGDNAGYTHYATCTDPDKFRKQRESRPKPNRAKVEGETAYADATPTQIGLPKHVKHLWAVAGANGLQAQPRDERIDNCNAILLDHNFEPVESWNDLMPESAQCLASAIDSKLLTWGEPNVELPLESEAA